METKLRLSENAWEYTGHVIVKSKEKPIISGEENNILTVDGVEIIFDEEIKFDE